MLAACTAAYLAACCDALKHKLQLHACCTAVHMAIHLLGLNILSTFQKPARGHLSRAQSECCAGDQFALFEAVIALAMLVRRFDFEMAENAPPVSMTTVRQGKHHVPCIN